MTYKAIVSLDIDSTQYMYQDPSQDDASIVLKNILEQLKANGDVFIVHNTGRPFPWVCHGEQVTRYLNPIIAKPNLLISHGGTVIWQEGGQEQYQSWRRKIIDIVKPETVRKLVEDFEAMGFNIDNETYGNEFKICLRTTPEKHADLIKEIRSHIQNAYPDKFDVMYWNNTSADITPRGINKRTALEHLMEQEGLKDVPVITGGDSMNDSPLLTHPNWKKIVVGNALLELKRITDGLSNVFQASSRDIAAKGVLAGLIHYGLIEEQNPETQGLLLSHQHFE
jgi:HAD superfamily hydrolase (TIGR01484 family)